MGCVQSNNACLRRCLTGAAMSVGIDEVVGLNLDILSRDGSLRGDQAEGAMTEPYPIESADLGGGSFLQLREHGQPKVVTRQSRLRNPRVPASVPLVVTDPLNIILSGVLEGDYRGSEFRDIMKNIFQRVVEVDPTLSNTIRLFLDATSSFLLIFLGELKDKLGTNEKLGTKEQECLQGLMDLLKNVVELVKVTHVLDDLPKSLGSHVQELLFDAYSEMTWKDVFTTVRAKLSENSRVRRGRTKVKAEEDVKKTRGIFQHLRKAIGAIAAHPLGRKVLRNIAGFDLLGILTYVLDFPPLNVEWLSAGTTLLDPIFDLLSAGTTREQENDGSRAAGGRRGVYEKLFDILLDVIARIARSANLKVCVPELKSQLSDHWGDTLSFLLSVINTAASEAVAGLKDNKNQSFPKAFHSMVKQFVKFFRAPEKNKKFTRAYGLLVESFLCPLLLGKSDAIRTQDILDALRGALSDEKFWPRLANLGVGLIEPVGEMLFNTAFGGQLLFPLENFKKDEVTALLQFVSDRLRYVWAGVGNESQAGIIVLICKMSVSFLPPTEIAEAFIKGTRGVDVSWWKLMMADALKKTLPGYSQEIAKTIVSFADGLAETSFGILSALGPPTQEEDPWKAAQQLMAKVLGVLMERYLSATKGGNGTETRVAASGVGKPEYLPPFNTVKQRWQAVTTQDDLDTMYKQKLPEELQKSQRAARADENYALATQIAKVELDMFRRKLHYFGRDATRFLLRDALQLVDKQNGILSVFVQRILQSKELLDKLLGNELGFLATLESLWSAAPKLDMGGFLMGNGRAVKTLWDEFGECKRVVTQMLLFKQFEDSWSNEWAKNDPELSKKLLKLWFAPKEKNRRLFEGKLNTPKRTTVHALGLKEAAYETWKQQPQAERDVFTGPPPQAVIDHFR